MQKQQVKLLDRVRHKIRLKHYSIRTEQAYVSWIKRYIHFHNMKHPKDMGEMEIEEFLTDLAASKINMLWMPPHRGAGQAPQSLPRP